MATGDPDLLKTKRKELIATHQEVNKLLQAATKRRPARRMLNAKNLSAQSPLMLCLLLSISAQS
jgi:hypothetical protein